MHCFYSFDFHRLGSDRMQTTPCSCYKFNLNNMIFSDCFLKGNLVSKMLNKNLIYHFYITMHSAFVLELDEFN